MSRHRYVKDLDYGVDDDYDDESSYSYGSVGSYGTSPSMAGYLYNSDRNGLGMSGEHAVFLRDESLLADLRPQIYKVINPNWPQAEVDQALRDSNYAVGPAARFLCEQEAFMSFPIDGDVEDDGLDDGLFAMEDEQEEESTATQTEPKRAGPRRVLEKREDPRPSAKSSTFGQVITKKQHNKKEQDTTISMEKKESRDVQAFTFDVPSPDDVVLEARKNAKMHIVSTEGKKKVPGGAHSSKDVNSVTTKAAPPQKKNIPKVSKADGISQRSAKKTSSVMAQLAKAKLSRESKEKLNMVVIGHVDAGKSTLMGHLLHLLGVVSQRQLRKLEKGSQDANKGSFSFAWVLDANDVERERGVTIEVGQAHFETQVKDVFLLDAPGHLDFVPNMITGAAQAEVALLVIDASPNSFESGFSEGGQTKEHAQLARSLGVRQLVVVVNKLDLVNWSKSRYEEVCEEISSFLIKQVRYKRKELQFVPCSGFGGENILKRSIPALCQWYDGPTLVEAIDKFESVKHDLSKPFRMYITEVIGNIQGKSGTVVGGKVESGILAVGDNLLLMPLYQMAVVKSLSLKSGAPTKYASSGDYVEIGLIGLDESVYGKGDILCDPQHPIPVARKIRAEMLVFTPARPILKGRQVLLHMHSICIPATISGLRALKDKKTGGIKKLKPRNLPHKCFAVVDISLEGSGLPMELYSDYQQFGRFMLRDDSATIAAGIVTELLKVKKREHE